MAAVFEHVATSGLYGLVALSPSPMVSTAAVTSAMVAAGENWEFLIVNDSGSDVAVSFSITFVAD